MPTSPSSASEQITDTDVKHLCSKTSGPAQCYELLKLDNRTSNIDAKGLAEVSLDLAANKARTIHAQLNTFAKATHDSKLRVIYSLCSKSYKDAIHDLDVAKMNLKSGANQDMPVRVNDAYEQVDICEKVLNKASTDHKHLNKKNKDSEFLVNVVKFMTYNLNKK